ncbi:MAG: hypothetical protein GKR99_13630 [Rhodobacteraceae bacterium]|nr:hypothetical protein [Paracoccaceae bacterium]
MSVLGGIIPVLALVLLSVWVPRALGRALPEGVGWLFVNGVTAAVILWAVSAGYFAGAYAMQADALSRLLGIDPVGTMGHFAWLGLLAGMIWLPIGLLALASVPKRWTEVVW